MEVKPTQNSTKNPFLCYEICSAYNLDRQVNLHGPTVT